MTEHPTMSAEQIWRAVGSGRGSGRHRPDRRSHLLVVTGRREGWDRLTGDGAASAAERDRL
ncbi:hypothetical protein IU427_19635 [Nocardia beijingensis]|uniref:hypothetical protein n=1 Tax=Nocardia beijingensis TaxID=95162 RepID=UPI0018959599|nr:hypothetical protein [Nocardia beijingensis]MBF6467378.1 hypothetical protein [Nocardia beijingensis]